MLSFKKIKKRKKKELENVKFNLINICVFVSNN